MYLTPTNKYWAIDIEADGLLDTVTQIWCLSACNIITGEEWYSSEPSEIYKWIADRRSEDCIFIGHNIVGYDAPVLNRFGNCGLSMAVLVDTLLLSMVYSPSLSGGHSLADWGQRLRSPKLDWHDFSKFSPAMLEYCRQDTKLCRLIYRDLVRRMTKEKFSELGIEIEHRAWQIIQQQRKNGFHFNIEEAHVLYAKLRGIENDIRDEIYKLWPPTLDVVATFKKGCKLDGSRTALYQRHLAEYERLEDTSDGGYRAYAYVSFKIGSPKERVEKLLELGWNPYPDEYTKPSKTHPNGQPAPTKKGQIVPSLVAFVEESNHPGPRLIAQWIEYNARGNMINTWIEAYNEHTHCIHGSLWLANTLRYRHSNPNTANIPAVRLSKEDKPLLGQAGVFTYEARDLWTTRSRTDRRLVGVDAKGIQLRVLAHYLNNKEFTDAVLAGDPHSYNQQIGGFATRAVSKTFIYAFLLGAGDAKVGQIIGGTQREGKEVKKRFVNNFPGLGELLDDLERQISRSGRITLCDGTPLLVTAPHTRLGYLLQGDESRIMKKAKIDVQRQIQRARLDVLWAGDIHDEWQSDVYEPHVSEYVQTCSTVFPEVGRFFNYNIPIECDAKVGLTWAETH